MIYIYGLRCPTTGEIRYIGKAADPELRLQQHLSTCRKRRTYRDKWLSRLRDDGLRPSLVILRRLDDGEDWAAAEREEIAKGRQRGWRLTNLTIGGDGVSPTPECRARLLAAARKESRRRKIAEGRRRFLADPSERAKIAEANKRRASDPEARARQSAALKKYWSDPERSGAHRATITADGRLKEQSQSMKNVWADPEYRARMAVAHKAAWLKRKG